MSLQLILGGSGSGKSHELYSSIIEDSINKPEINYIVIVPEQYTMETQKKLVSMHPRQGIMNIDIVSFQRLAYRVFSEIGGGDEKVLDDTGKNLIVRKVLEEKKKELKIFGNTINRIGFVSEMKSVVSELLQYSVTPEEVLEIDAKISDNPLLSAKLSDIQIVYDAFKKCIEEKYITAEEILDVLCRVIEESGLIRNSIIAIDGFTGFTPVQYKLLGKLLRCAKKVIVTVTIDTEEKLNVHEGMQNIFFLSKETIAKLVKTADDQNLPVEDNILIGENLSGRHSNVPDLAFLEKNIFRFGRKSYEKSPESLLIYEASNPKEEISYIAGEIMRLTAAGEYRFRDIGVVTGDISVYGDLAANIFAQNNITCFIDNKRSVIGNPFVEFIRSALEIIEKGYSYESVFRYLKTGLADVPAEDTDELENYCLAMGIRGSRRWKEDWIRNYRNRRGGAADLERINSIRKSVSGPLAILEERLKDKEADVKEYVTALYEFVVSMEIQRKLAAYSETFENEGEKSRSGEFRQVYAKVMELFDKIVELLGDEKISVREFSDILDAGFEEIKIGLIPPSADSVVVGDIERTRLDNIKVVFFAGVNDGIVPKKSGAQGILSELDRDSLEKIQVKLAPSAREKAFIQKFYLYLNLTKPSDRLVISYSRNDVNGKSIVPSYLLHNIRKMFPKIRLTNSEGEFEVFRYLQIPKAETVWTVESCVRAITEAAALELYGKEMYDSVTRVENFAACQYAHFLNYGLALSEREEYQVAVADIGNILHSVVERVSVNLKKTGRKFSEITEAERKELVTTTVAEVTNDYGNTIMQDSKRNEYLVNRLTDLADRTVWAIGKQLANGEFEPDLFEAPFELEPEQLPNGAQMILRGKIDRIDICEDDKNVYVKVVDYKTGNSDFNLLKTYYGLKLQLLAYMKAAVGIEEKRHPDKKIVPAGVLYYNISDPIIDKKDEAEEETEVRILEELCTKGLINRDSEIVRKFDNTIESGKSKVVPLKLNSNGEVADTKSAISGMQFVGLERFASDKMKEMAEDIISGSIALNPYKDKQETPCTYCSYGAVCGFHEDLPGMEYRKLKKFDDDVLWGRICAQETVMESTESVDDLESSDRIIDTDVSKGEQ